MPFDIAAVVPTYNRAELLRETLRSILAQSHRPAEVIVVDDGSTDGTAAMIKEFDGSVRYHAIENAGVCRARNIGVSLAKAPWIAFCDSDDLWRPDFLAQHVALLRAAPELSYAFSNFVPVRDNAWGTRSKFDQVPPDFWDMPKRAVSASSWIATAPLYRHILRFQPIFISTVVLSRIFFDRVGGFDERFGRTIAEDFEFTLRCMQHSPVGVVTDPLVGIRRHAGNFSGNDLANTLGDIEILRHALAHHDAAGAVRDIIDDEICRRSAEAAGAAFSAGDLDRLRALSAAVPSSYRSTALRVKFAVAGLPRPAGRILRRLLQAASDRIRPATKP